MDMKPVVAEAVACACALLKAFLQEGEQLGLRDRQLVTPKNVGLIYPVETD